ncbi:hypothetical protein [Paenarthrobacter nitroguajacolicus]|uniref:hypothetical protein n=1 Tax=Paenarthrobacter nitroguajacolicus TaxID=211146 RepID=UPI003D1DA3D5
MLWNALPGGIDVVSNSEGLAGKDTLVRQHRPIISSKFGVVIFEFFPFLNASLPCADSVRVSAVDLLPAAWAVLF